MSLFEQVLELLPTDGAQAVTAKELFDSCKDAEDTYQVSTVLSQLFLKGKINRKKVNLGVTRYAYWKPADAKEKAEVPTFIRPKVEESPKAELKVSSIELKEPSEKWSADKDPKPAEGKKPHKHAELIKAWADGAEIQCRYISAQTPHWTDMLKYMFDEQGWDFRIKPVEHLVEANVYFAGQGDYKWALVNGTAKSNVKFTFDGDGKLIKAEVL